MFCVFCGKELPDDARFCSACGKALDEKAVGSVAERDEKGERKGSGRIRRGVMVRSIISLFGLIIPGVFAIIFTLRAAKAETEAEEKRCLAKAKLMSFIAYGVFILAMVVFIVIIFGYVFRSLRDILSDAGFNLFFKTVSGGLR